MGERVMRFGRDRVGQLLTEVLLTHHAELCLTLAIRN